MTRNPSQRPVADGRNTSRRQYEPRFAAAMVFCEGGSGLNVASMPTEVTASSQTWRSTFDLSAETKKSSHVMIGAGVVLHTVGTRPAQEHKSLRCITNKIQTMDTPKDHMVLPASLQCVEGAPA